MQFQNIWLSVNSDLEYAKTSLQELFYVLDLDMEADKVKALVEVADVITAIPTKVETLYHRATQEGYQVRLTITRDYPAPINF